LKWPSSIVLLPSLCSKKLSLSLSFSHSLSLSPCSTKATGDLVAIKLIKRPLPKIILPNILREIRVREKAKERLKKLVPFFVVLMLLWRRDFASFSKRLAALSCVLSPSLRDRGKKRGEPTCCERDRKRKEKERAKKEEKRGHPFSFFSFCSPLFLYATSSSPRSSSSSSLSPSPLRRFSLPRPPPHTHTQKKKNRSRPTSARGTSTSSMPARPC